MAEETGTDRRAKAINVVADVVRWAGLTIAVILVVHVVLVAGEANPANWITRFVRSLAEVFSLGFKDLFTKPADDPKLRVLINYGIAAIFWLIVSAFLAKLIRRLAPSP
jgi:hypothetical protein